MRITKTGIHIPEGNERYYGLGEVAHVLWQTCVEIIDVWTGSRKRSTGSIRLSAICMFYAKTAHIVNHFQVREMITAFAIKITNGVKIMISVVLQKVRRMIRMSKRVVFISLPMSGVPEELVRANIERAKEAYLAITKLDASQVAFIHNLNNESETVDADIPDVLRRENVWHLGRAVQELAKCDEVFFCLRWNSAKGCRIEYEVCRTYGIPRITVDYGMKG